MTKNPDDAQKPEEEPDDPPAAPKPDEAASTPSAETAGDADGGAEAETAAAAVTDESAEPDTSTSDDPATDTAPSDDDAEPDTTVAPSDDEAATGDAAGAAVPPSADEAARDTADESAVPDSTADAPAEEDTTAEAEPDTATDAPSADEPGAAGDVTDTAVPPSDDEATSGDTAQPAESATTSPDGDATAEPQTTPSDDDTASADTTTAAAADTADKSAEADATADADPAPSTETAVAPSDDEAAGDRAEPAESATSPDGDATAEPQTTPSEDDTAGTDTTTAAATDTADEPAKPDTTAEAEPDTAPSTDDAAVAADTTDTAITPSDDEADAADTTDTAVTPSDDEADAGDAAEPAESATSPDGDAKAEPATTPSDDEATSEDTAGADTATAEPDSTADDSAAAPADEDAAAEAEPDTAGAPSADEQGAAGDTTDTAVAPSPLPDVPEEAPPTPRDKKPRRRGRYVLLAAVVAVALLVGSWAVDSAGSSDQVARNVEIAGEDIGGIDETELRAVVTEIATAQTQRPVTIKAGDKTYETTAGALGLSVDEQATVDAALDAGNDGNPLLRPFGWLVSFFRPREVDLRYKVDKVQATANLDALQGPDRTAPVDPTMPLAEAGFAMVPGQEGRGIDSATFPDLFLTAAEESTDGRIVVDTEVTVLEPAYTDQEVQALADRANEMTAAGLSVKAGPVEVAVPPGQLRNWIGLAPTDNGLDIVLNNEAVNASLPALVGVVGAAPVNATVTLDANGAPVVVPGSNGVTCCGQNSGERIWTALGASEPRVELEVTDAEPEWTTAEVQAWGITQPVGGSRAWRNGGEVPGPAPGFTTYHDCCAARVRNIQRLADMVRGAVIPPGGDFSINDYVGPRTAAKGFVLAGAIAQGMHVDEIGGGVSQFATTTFNAAYFAGLDITAYQAHTEYFSRYPRGREATMGYPKPDLAIHNNTPYGLMIWTSYTDTSLTVTFYSTPWANAEQTGISESRHGGCRTVVTTRTRWFPDGTSADDTFKATYRPGEGQFC